MNAFLRVQKLLALSSLFLLSACFGSGDGGPPAEDAIGGDVAADGIITIDASGNDWTDLEVGTEGETTPRYSEFSPATAAALQALVDEHVIFSADPGVTLTVLADDGRFWSSAGGTGILQDASQMTPDMGFRVGSNTKPFVATVVLQLVDDGLIGLDDDLTLYLPQYSQWAGITIRHLLGMRSGIVDYLTLADFMLGTIEEADQAITPEEILAYVADEPLQFDPDTGGQYNNSSYLLLGMIIEAVTGNPVEDELHNRLVAPLQLDFTFLDMVGEEDPTVAHGYMDLNLVGQIFNVPPALLAFIPEENQYEGTIVDTTYLFHPSITWSAGALISTAPDMTRFMRALITGDLLSPARLDEMKSTQEIILLGSPVQYGLGLQVRQTPYGELVGHGGLNFGYQAGTYYHAASGMTFSHMHNFLPEQSDSFQNELLAILTAEEVEPPIVCEPPAGFFDADGGPTLHARFKGEVNPLGAEILVAGVNQFLQVEGDESTSLYGWGSRAKLAMSGLQMRLVTESFAPADDGPNSLRTASVSMALNLFDLLDANGDFSLSMAQAGALFVTVADLVVLDEAGNMELCFIAVNDFSRPSHVHVCDADSFSPEAGQDLRFFAALALETDPEKVEQTLATINIPICLCGDAEGNWAACEE